MRIIVRKRFLTFTEVDAANAVVFYSMAGRSEEGFNSSASSQILSNAVEYDRPAA